MKDLIKIATIFVDIIYCLALPRILTIVSVVWQMFYSPGSINELHVWVLFISVLLVPITILIAVIGSLVLLFKFKLYGKAIILTLLPLVYVGIAISYFSNRL